MLDFKSFGRLFHFHAPLYWILRDLQNFHPIRKPNLVINLLFILSISKFLTSLPSRRLSLKLWLISRHGFKIEKKKFTFADTPQKVDNILRAICFAYSCIFSIQLFCLRTAVNAIFFFSSLNKRVLTYGLINNYSTRARWIWDDR